MVKNVRLQLLSDQFWTYLIKSSYYHHVIIKDTEHQYTIDTLA